MFDFNVLEHKKTTILSHGLLFFMTAIKQYH